jgi:hypothetical protein
MEEASIGLRVSLALCDDGKGGGDSVLCHCQTERNMQNMQNLPSLLIYDPEQHQFERASAR